MSKEQIYDLIFQGDDVKWQSIIYELVREGKVDPWDLDVSVLAKETDTTYSHTVKLLELFKSYGLVDFDKQGRIKFVKLTQDGTELATNFEDVLRKVAKLKPKKK